MGIFSKPFQASIVLSVEEAQELMIRVREVDDGVAFRRLYERYKGGILSYVFQMVQNHEAAEELTHEVFLRAYRARKSFEPRAKVSTWLWSIARNASLDHLKKKRELLGTSEDIASDEALGFESEWSSAERQIIEKSDVAIVQDCVSRLNRSQREALSLKLFSDLSYGEISHELQLKESAVKSLLSRARSNLMKCLRTKGLRVGRDE